MRIYLDSAPIIYLIEDVAPYASALESRLTDPDAVQVCSELSRMESRVKPIRDDKEALLAAAIVGECDLFLTKDHRLGRCTEIVVEII